MLLVVEDVVELRPAVEDVVHELLQGFPDAPSDSCCVVLFVIKKSSEGLLLLGGDGAEAVRAEDRAQVVLGVLKLVEERRVDSGGGEVDNSFVDGRSRGNDDGMALHHGGGRLLGRLLVEVVLGIGPRVVRAGQVVVDLLRPSRNPSLVGDVLLDEAGHVVGLLPEVEDREERVGLLGLGEVVGNFPFFRLFIFKVGVLELVEDLSLEGVEAVLVAPPFGISDFASHLSINNDSYKCFVFRKQVYEF